MDTKAILWLLLLIITIGIFSFQSIENFFDLASNMIEFTRLDGSLIKKVKVGSSISLYDQEVINLFRQDDVIQIVIPENYSVKIIYKFRNESKGFGKTINLYAGSHDIAKTIGNKQIFQIDARNEYGLNQNVSDLFVKNVDGHIIYTGPQIVPIDWDLIYSNFGYDDYYIFYPSTNMVKTYYYYNYPRYKLYRPSKRIQRERYYPTTWQKDKFFRYRSEFDTESDPLLMEPPQRITYSGGYREENSNIKQSENHMRPMIRGKGQWIMPDGNPVARGKGQWIMPDGNSVARGKGQWIMADGNPVARGKGQWIVPGKEIKVQRESKKLEKLENPI